VIPTTIGVFFQPDDDSVVVNGDVGFATLSVRDRAGHFGLTIYVDTTMGKCPQRRARDLEILEDLGTQIIDAVLRARKAAER
jgi:hypothetical protein